MGYEKPWKDYRDQLKQLQDRGMVADDPEHAIDYLHRIGYYRLSGYWFAFRERSGPLVVLAENGRKPKKVKEETQALDSFKPGTKFHDVVDLYVFDKRLRMLVLDAVERIEVAMRVEVSHTLGRLDTFAHLRPDLLHEDFATKLHPEVCLTRHHQWCTKQAQLIGRSREEFVKHNKARYGLPLAIWVACAAVPVSTCAARGESTFILARASEETPAGLPRPRACRAEFVRDGRAGQLARYLVMHRNKEPLRHSAACAAKQGGAVLGES